MIPYLINIFKLLFLAAKAWIKDKAPQLSATLAFFTMLSLSPLLLTVTSIAGLFYDQPTAQTELVEQVRQLAGEDGATVVQNALQNAQFSENKSLLSGITAAGILLFASTAVFVHLQSALNQIWNVKPGGNPDMSVGKRLLLIRGRSLALVLCIGFLLVISLVASAAITLLGDSLSEIWEFLDDLLRIAVNLISLVVIGGLFSLMFKFLPDTKVDTRAAVIGGLSTAGLLTIGKWGIGLYLGNSAVGSAYGAAGSLVAFLLWIYYSMLVFFYGAEFTYVLSKARLIKAEAHQADSPSAN
ncbi:YihY/virulence factor BrkB family protein [Kiritimatiellaeota bacterium B1221]|nr:YihY/virulence factor BrkB family protein [Kiritimatiellaeota bacterium B1221]